MNERIKELVEQAGLALKPRRLDDDNKPDGYLESDDEYFQYNLEATRVFFEGGLEKFAELIVRECAQMCIHNEHFVKYSVASDYAQKAADAFKKHFGVEE